MRALLRCLGLLFACLIGEDALAQNAGAARPRVPVTIAIVDHLPRGGAEFLIVRRSEGDPPDLILLRTGATARDLSHAVRTLLAVRRLNGDTASVSTTMRLRPRNASQPSLPPLPWAARVVADAHSATPRVINGIGRARTVRIWLPAQRSRSR